MRTKTDRLIHVAVAVISDAAGRFLISRRHDSAHEGGYWEFPGGKVERGETVSHALHREINEELGLLVVDHRPLIKIIHHYPDRSVLLDVHRVTQYSGVAEGLEGQQLAWAGVGELAQYALLPADRPIVTTLSLPDRYLITGANPADRDGFLSRLQSALEGGVSLLQLRAKSLPEDEFHLLAKDVLALCRRYGARCLLNSAPELVAQLGAGGVHLTGQRLHALRERPLGSEYLVAASCHSAADLAKAATLGLDFAVLSPVLPTASHSQVQPLGWGCFAEWSEEALLPLYALGGMQPEMIPEAQRHGAQGIAGISGLWLENTTD